MYLYQGLRRRLVYILYLNKQFLVVITGPTTARADPVGRKPMEPKRAA